MLTSLPSESLDATRWLHFNRSHWDIETGLHARLDISRRDDQCRLRAANAVHVHGIFARLAKAPLHGRAQPRRAPLSNALLASCATA